jgi:hypothetical protein
MPSARFFRIQIGDTKKEALEISAIHLYNDNTRVDQTATLSSGFGLNATQLEPIKSDAPAAGTKIDVNLKLNRVTATYIVWTFASAVNVNAFRIGSGEREDSFLDKFSLQYSDDGITYWPFINILLDKKLFYPGPWQLSDLKPVGEGYPFCMSKVDQLIGSTGGSDVSLQDNYSFKNSRNGNTGSKSQNWVGNGMVNYALGLPGYFKSGKYYFEVTCATKNTYGIDTGYNSFVLGLFKDATERLSNFRDEAAPGASLCLNKSSQQTSGAGPRQYNHHYPYADDLPYKKFVPGVQHGLAIDFDTHTIQVVNPTWSDKPPGTYPVSRSNFASNTALGDKIRLAIITTGSYGLHILNDSMTINFGQAAFVNPVPAGFQPCFGPRWREVPHDFVMKEINLWTFNADGVSDMKQTGDDFYTNYNVGKTVNALDQGVGSYYIKGTISRVPNIENKRFMTLLFSHQSNRVIDQCVASNQGLYEFYGIEYGLYSIFSVDLRTGITSESIGPVYPKEIV